MSNVFRINELNEVEKRLKLLDAGDIYCELNSFLNSSNKRIRSLVAILYLKSLNVEIEDGVFNILAAGELLHNASLLHDDILDNADKRRGLPTIGTKFSPEISILSGDYLLSKATEILLQNQNFNIMKIFVNCSKKMCDAEFKQYFLRGQIPSIEEYLEIAEGKTAILFETILEACAELCDLDKDNAKKFGQNFGILFQLKNDLEKKSAEADKQNKIFTPKDIIGIEKTNNLIDNYQREIEKCISSLPVNFYKNRLEDILRVL